MMNEECGILKNIRFLFQGESGLVVEFGNVIDSKLNTAVHQLAIALKSDHLPGIIATVPTYRSLLVMFDPVELERFKLIAHIETLITKCCCQKDLQFDSKMRVVVIPTCYGDEYGPDLQFVADHNGITETDVIRFHTMAPYKIYMMGFTPGFPYLGGVSEKIAAPRLETPRTVIPAGSVGIAGTQTGLYPVESPGGWRLIGRTPLKVFDVNTSEPFIYSAGDYLLFRSISSLEFASIRLEVESGSYIPEILSGTKAVEL